MTESSEPTWLERLQQELEWGSTAAKIIVPPKQPERVNVVVGLTVKLVSRYTMKKLKETQPK